MIIRELNSIDLPKLADLYEQFWGDKSDVPKMELQLEFIKREKMHIILVCEEQGQVVGSVMGIVCRELYGDCRPFMVVENMIVDKTYRRSGIGQALLQELERMAKERNCTQMILVTEKDREDACGFYEAYGFSKNTTGYKKKL